MMGEQLNVTSKVIQATSENTTYYASSPQQTLEIKEMYIRNMFLVSVYITAPSTLYFGLKLIAVLFRNSTL